MINKSWIFHFLIFWEKYTQYCRDSCLRHIWRGSRSLVMHDYYKECTPSLNLFSTKLLVFSLQPAAPSVIRKHCRRTFAALPTLSNLSPKIHRYSSYFSELVINHLTRCLTTGAQVTLTCGWPAPWATGRHSWWSPGPRVSPAPPGAPSTTSPCSGEQRAQRILCSVQGEDNLNVRGTRC